MTNDDSLSAVDRARLGVEAAFIGLTPNLGTGPVADAYVEQDPSAGIVRAAQDLIEADSDARELGDAADSEQASEHEAADEGDPPDGFIDSIESLNIEWNSPFVDYVDSADLPESDTERAADSSLDAGADSGEPGDSRS